jgi:DNA-binding XRE family transcriptional regulator
MKLSDWLELRQISDTDFASLVEADRGTISRIRRGVNRPSWELAARIKAATEGAVAPDEFLPSEQ